MTKWPAMITALMVTLTTGSCSLSILHYFYQEGGVCVKLAVAYQVNGQEFWDNNQQQNFLLELSE